MAEIIINKEKHECAPAVAAYIKELRKENARLEESFQRATGEIAADPLPRHGRWIFKERNELVPTGEFGVAEGHHVHLSAGATFKPNEKGVVVLKEHKRVKKPYCSECGDHGDDEFDATPVCPNCGAIMDGGAEGRMKIKEGMEEAWERVVELKAENARLEEGYQKSIGVIAATDCVKCKDKAYINNDENAEKWRHFELTT